MKKGVKSLLLIAFALLYSCYDSNSLVGDADSSNEIDVTTESETSNEDLELPDENEIPDADIVEDDSFCTFGKIGGDTQLTFHSRPMHHASGPMLAFTGSEFGLAWNDSRNDPPSSQVFFSRLSLAGEEVQEDTLISELDNPGFPFITFDGDNFALILRGIYGDPPVSVIIFSKVSAEGEKIGHDNIIYEGFIEVPVMAVAGNEYGVIWSDMEIPSGIESVKFMKIGEGGEILVDPLIVVADRNYVGTPSSIVFSGSEFAVLWQDEYWYDINLFFQRISTDGTLLGSTLQITHTYSCESPSIAFTGSEYGVVCYGHWTEDTNDILLIRLSPDGEMLGEEIRLTEGIADLRFPSIAYSGSEYGISWADWEHRIIMGRFQPDGERIQGEIEVINSAITNRGTIPLVSTGSEYSMVWEYDENIYFTKIGCTR